jgi:hypothetical protein
VPVDLELDMPVKIDRAWAWLRSLMDHGDVAVEGQRGDDDRTYQVACYVTLGSAPKLPWRCYWNRAAGPSCAGRITRALNGSRIRPARPFAEAALLLFSSSREDVDPGRFRSSKL